MQFEIWIKCHLSLRPKDLMELHPLAHHHLVWQRVLYTALTYSSIYFSLMQKISFRMYMHLPLVTKSLTLSFINCVKIRMKCNFAQKTKPPQSLCHTDLDVFSLSLSNVSGIALFLTHFLSPDVFVCACGIFKIKKRCAPLSCGSFCLHFTLHSFHFVYVGLVRVCACVCGYICINISHNTLMFDDLNEFGYEFENNHAIIYQNDFSRAYYLFIRIRTEESRAMDGEGEGGTRKW